jgi:hypothetical protein
MTQKTKIILDEFKKEFLARVSKKTGWGKNEIEKVFNESLIEILSANVDNE